jgi:serine protease Do
MDNLHLSEIEKIQAEIEKDLKKIWEPAVQEPVIEPAAEIAAEMAAEMAAEPEIPTPSPVQESFYRETIKAEPVYSNNTTARPRSRKERSWPRTVAVLCLVCTLGTGSLGFGLGAAGLYARHHWLNGVTGMGQADGVNAHDTQNAHDFLRSTQYVFSDASAPAQGGSLSDMIRLVEPSVVNVSSVFDASGRNASGQGVASGSGIIFSEDTRLVYIATNNHMVGGAAQVTVSVAGSEPVPASPVGSDAEADLSVISVSKQDLQKAGVRSIVIAVFGDSDTMEVGDVVLAIGNAMGEGNSATRGIISAKERTVTIEGRTLTMLQTDAAINRGNSGGPLVNARGEVIGIITAKLSANFYASVEGMGYSISSNIAKPILEDLMNRTSRPALGIYGLTVTDEIAEELSIPPMGVYVQAIIRGSGAEKAGIDRTDIITGFNGRPILSMEQLIEEIRKCQVGEKVVVKILRGGKDTMELEVTLGEMAVDNF